MFRSLIALLTLYLYAAALAAVELPAGTTLEVRLNQPSGSRSSRIGQRVEATVIAPLLVADRVVVPSGATLIGEVSYVRRLRFGFRHATAGLAWRFHTLEFDDGRAVPVETRLVAVDTAREQVDIRGRIEGIRATTNVSSPLAVYAWRLLLLEPPVAVPVWLTKFAFARSPDPEIYFPAGTELLLELTAPLLSESNHPPGEPPLAPLPPEWLNQIPQQRLTRKSGRPSDLVNLVFVGSRAELETAFRSAGWSGAQRRSPWSVFRSYRSIVERRSYADAPMSSLFLDGRLPDLAFQKNLNTFAKRHHIRVWNTGRDEHGRPVWVAAATEDTGIHFSWKKLRWVHVSDPRIDHERSKVVNDLAFTGCVDQAALFERELPHAEWFRTDGRLATLFLNACAVPRTAPNAARNAHPRGLRAAFRAFSGDVFRSNFVFLGYQTTRLATAVKSAFVRPMPVSPRGPAPGRERQLTEAPPASRAGPAR